MTHLYLAISDLPMEPDELHDMVDEIYNVSGAIQDFVLLYDKSSMEKRSVSNREWLFQNAMKRYYRGLEKLRELL